MILSKPALVLPLLLAPLLAPRGERSGDLGGTNQVLRERSLAMDPKLFPIGRRVPDLAFTDVTGATGRLSDYADRKGLVIAVRDATCPVSNRSGHKLARVEQDYAARGIGFLFVDMSPVDTVEDIVADAEKYGFRGRFAVDPEAVLGKALRASTTTDVFVLDRKRTLVYRGSIDDQYGRGYSLPAPNHRYLRDALDGVLTGTEIAIKATNAPGCFLELELPEEDLEFAPGEITWHGDIHRIVQQRCLPCHREGGAGPFALDDYDAVKKRKMVRFVVDKGVMPPWYTAEHTGPFLNDTRLSDWQRAAMLHWIADGYPEGEPEAEPVPREFPDSWSIGKPDVIFRPETISRIPAEGPGSYRPIECEAVADRDMWVRKIEVLPEHPQVVHHAMVMMKAPGREATDYANSLERHILPWAKGETGWNYFAGFLPGMNPAEYPEGTAVFVPKGAQFLFYMHYNPNGVAVSDRTSLGLVLADGPPKYRAHMDMWRKRGKWKVPANEPSVRFELDYPVTHDRILRSVTPHMHLRGKVIQAELRHPDGRVEPLIDIQDWDQDWQFLYTFLRPKYVRKGSVIHLEAEYDNSPNNPNNPDPTVDVYNGPLTKDEMMMLGLEWIDPYQGRGAARE
jgi:hypothetical protein